MLDFFLLLKFLLIQTSTDEEIADCFPTTKLSSNLFQNSSTATLKFQLTPNEMKFISLLFENGAFIIQQIKNSILKMNSCNSESDRTIYLAHAEQQLYFIDQLKKISRDHDVSNYEFYKLCEFIYNTLYQIISFRKDYCNQLFVFLVMQIFPILVEIENLFHSHIWICNKYTFDVLNDSSSQFLDENSRCIMLYNFCNEQFINIESGQSDLAQRFLKVSELRNFCSYMFAKAYLINHENYHDFQRRLEKSTSLISDEVKNLLVLDMQILELVDKAHDSLSIYVNENFGLMELYFEKYNMISPIYDRCDELTVNYNMRENPFQYQLFRCDGQD